MDLRIGQLGFTNPPAAPRTATARGEFTLPRTDTADIGPPPDVLREVDAAAARAEALWREGRELHFEVSDGGRVIVQVRDREGQVIRTIPPSEALDVMSGKAL